jgi:hypothetical protein
MKNKKTKKLVCLDCTKWCPDGLASDYAGWCTAQGCYRKSGVCTCKQHARLKKKASS